MSTNLPSFRTALGGLLADQPRNVQRAHNTIWNAITDIYQAIPQLKSQIDAVKSSSSSSTSSSSTSSTSSSTSSASVTPSQAASIANAQALRAIATTLGTVNPQSTSYTAQPSDFGGIVSVTSSSPTTVTLDESKVQPQFFTSLTNTGTSTTTVQPSSGLINGASSISLAAGQAATVFFDGINWSASTSLPGTITEISTASGLSGGGSSGSVMLEIAATGVTAGTYTLPTIVVNAQGLVTSASNGPTGINATIVTAALTPTGAQGSMTFVNGVLTAQTPAS